MNLFKKQPSVFSDPLPKELLEKILKESDSVCATMLLNKSWNQHFNQAMLPHCATPQAFHSFLINYCNEKIETNRRWAYYAYKNYGNKSDYNNYSTNLMRYKRKIYFDATPFKHMLMCIAANIVFNFQICFRPIGTAILSNSRAISFSFRSCHFKDIGGSSEERWFK